MEYQTPLVQDFGSIAAHTFTAGVIPPKTNTDPGHIDAHGECSGGSGDANYPEPCNPPFLG